MLSDGGYGTFRRVFQRSGGGTTAVKRASTRENKLHALSFANVIPPFPDYTHISLFWRVTFELKKHRFLHVNRKKSYHTSKYTSKGCLCVPREESFYNLIFLVSNLLRKTCFCSCRRFFRALTSVRTSKTCVSIPLSQAPGHGLYLGGRAFGPL